MFWKSTKNQQQWQWHHCRWYTDNIVIMNMQTKVTGSKGRIRFTRLVQWLIIIALKLKLFWYLYYGCFLPAFLSTFSVLFALYGCFPLVVYILIVTCVAICWWDYRWFVCTSIDFLGSIRRVIVTCFLPLSLSSHGLILSCLTKHMVTMVRQEAIENSLSVFLLQLCLIIMQSDITDLIICRRDSCRQNWLDDLFCLSDIHRIFFLLPCSLWQYLMYSSSCINKGFKDKEQVMKRP